MGSEATMEWSTDIAALTPDAIHRVCRAIKNGANEDDAAYNAGLDPQALHYSLPS